MEKRLVAAIALSLLVLLTWSRFMPKPQTSVSQDVRIQTSLTGQPKAINETIPSLAPLPQSDIPEKLILYVQDNLEATFVESLAAIKEVKFKNYNNYAFLLKFTGLLKDPTLIFKKDQLSDNSISFIAVTPQKKVTKKFIFNKSNYTIDLEIIIQDTALPPASFNIPLVLGILDFSSSNHQARYQDVTVAAQDKLVHMNARKSINLEEVKFIGLRDQYFTAIIEPAEDSHSGYINKLNNNETEVGLNVQSGHLYHMYIGPQDVNMLIKNNPAWAGVIHYGTFDFISQILLQALGFIYKLVHNWGLAIILLSLVVYLILYPLSLKQMRSMKEMQILQPKVEELRKTYKDNPQRMNKEVMELYKEHKVNPLGGCLPLLLQMPIFFALYNALIRSIVLKGARFLWIKDLSEPDRLWIFPASWPNLPIIGNELNILPIIMAIGMFVQQKISSVSSGGASAEQQKIMLIVMPLMFGLIFYRMPAGLVMYWFVNSLLMLIFQLRMNRAK